MKEVLFITDNCDYPKEYTIKNRDSEGNKPFARDEMVKALSKIFDNVYITYSLEEANRYIIEKENLFVVTTYYGVAEADSKSIIPAMCKANGVKYLGADAYTQMICNDKYLSKEYIKKFNLKAIPGVIIYSPTNEIELLEIKKLSYPLIVKPNYGGGSNGITSDSITYNYNQTINLVNQLYHYQQMPIIVEEYISGFEVSFIIVGNSSEIILSGESELCIDNKKYFDKEIFGLESKKIAPTRKDYCESNHIPDEIQQKMFQLFKSFDKCEFMRIDCRITKEGDVYILELSPDCYIGSKGAFQETLRRQGYDFENMLNLLIQNSINNQNH